MGNTATNCGVPTTPCTSEVTLGGHKPVSVDIDVAAGEHAICTFYNRKLPTSATLILSKRVNVDDSEDVDFDFDGDLERFDVPELRTNFKAELVQTLTARTTDGPLIPALGAGSLWGREDPPWSALATKATVAVTLAVAWVTAGLPKLLRGWLSLGDQRVAEILVDRDLGVLGSPFASMPWPALEAVDGIVVIGES